MRRKAQRDRVAASLRDVLLTSAPNEQTLHRAIGDEDVVALMLVRDGTLVAQVGVEGDVDALVSYLAARGRGFRSSAFERELTIRLPNGEAVWELIHASNLDLFFRLNEHEAVAAMPVSTSHGRGLAFWLAESGPIFHASSDVEHWEHRGEVARVAERFANVERWPDVRGHGNELMAVPGATLYVAASADYPLSVPGALAAAPSTDFSLVAVMENAELYRGLEIADARIAFALAAALGLACALALVLARSYRRSIDALERGISAIGRGEWTQLPRGAGNELSTTLVDSLNTAVQRASTRAKERDVETWSALLRNIAHEVNNTLAPIKSLAQGMQGRSAELIAERADALASFVARCSELAKLPPPSLQRVDVAALVRAAAQMYAPLAAARNVRVVLDVSTAWAAADPAQMERVLLNLVKNAIEAARACVKITVTSLDHVSVVISDDGDGISDDAARKIGTPFFTTKPTGTGLGFTLAQQIVQAHGGSLALKNGTVGALATMSVPHA